MTSRPVQIVHANGSVRRIFHGFDSRVTIKMENRLSRPLDYAPIERYVVGRYRYGRGLRMANEFELLTMR
jgi:hypothetical protein